MPRHGVRVAIRTRPTTHFAADQIVINGNVRVCVLLV